MLRSAAEGSATPDGWLCARITAAALCFSDARTTSRGCTDAPSSVPRNSSSKASTRWRLSRKRHAKTSYGLCASCAFRNAALSRGLANAVRPVSSSPRHRRASSSAAARRARFAGPRPGAPARSRASNAFKLPACASRLRPMSSALLPRMPLPKSTASNSAGVNAAAPRVSNFSRGRSSSGQSRMLIAAFLVTGLQHGARAAADAAARMRDSGKLITDLPVSGCRHECCATSSRRTWVQRQQACSARRLGWHRRIQGLRSRASPARRGRAGACGADRKRRALRHAADVPGTLRQPVRHGLWDAEAEMGMSHLELARWADAVLIAPASADTLARLAHGFADDLLSTLCLATTAPVAVAPAMNHRMWLHPATQANVATLRARGVAILGPANGPLAEGESGP